MSLTADPPACTVPAARGSSTHKIVFKSMSLNNNEYRITPVFEFVDPSGSKDVTRTAGAPMEDKLVVHFAPAAADDADAHAAFGAATPPRFHCNHAQSVLSLNNQFQV